MNKNCPFTFNISFEKKKFKLILLSFEGFTYSKKYIYYVIINKFEQKITNWTHFGDHFVGVPRHLYDAT